MNMKYVLILVMCLSKLCPSQTALQFSMCVYFAVLIGLSRVRASVYLCASLAVFPVHCFAPHVLYGKAKENRNGIIIEKE